MQEEHERLHKEAQKKTVAPFCTMGLEEYKDELENRIDDYEQAYTALLAYHTKAISEKDGIIQDLFTATQRMQKLYDLKKARFKKEIRKLLAENVHFKAEVLKADKRAYDLLTENKKLRGTI